MSTQHGSGRLVFSLGRKIVFFCALYCFSLWQIHSVLSNEEDKPEQVLDASDQHQLTKRADISSTHSLPNTSPKKLQDKLDQEYRTHGRSYEGRIFADIFIGSSGHWILAKHTLFTCRQLVGAIRIRSSLDER